MRRQTIIETPRLVLRRPRLSDVPSLFTFPGDAGAMRYTKADTSLQACRRRIAAHEWRRRRDGCAPWVIVIKDAANADAACVAGANSRIVGWGGLYIDPFESGWGVELGYFLDPSIWGQGYATELARACVTMADDGFALPALSALAHPDKHASRRVLEKAGFKVERFVGNLNRLLFRRTRPVTQI